MCWLLHILCRAGPPWMRPRDGSNQPSAPEGPGHTRQGGSLQRLCPNTGTYRRLVSHKDGRTGWWPPFAASGVVVSTFPISCWSFLGDQPVSFRPALPTVLALQPGLLAWVSPAARSHPQLCILAFPGRMGRSPHRGQCSWRLPCCYSVAV